MSKAKFTYDESGATFFYFVLSFLALLLIPSTYYLWPKEQKEDERKTRCCCGGCQSKRQRTADQSKCKKLKSQSIRGLIIIGWAAFFLLAYKCATIQHEKVNWDPFEILGVNDVASQDDIRKAYRQQSLILHPDKETGDADAFVKLTKAYAALTDEESKKNWEQYGNPDGPSATSFGIALPSWIIEKENSVVVLGIYALIFMVALPVSVGIWWYRSVKFGSDKVLINTSELYYYFIHKTPNMALKRVIMILAASLEFAKSHNPEIIERPTDNQEVPRLIRDSTNLGEKNKERPLCFSYSIKSRAILHAHLSRMKLPEKTLEVDRCMIVGKCPHLLQEFVSCVAQLITLALSGRLQNMPSLVTLENAMKLGPLIVQALWEYQSPLLQLPHFSEDTLRYLERKKIKVRSIDQLARMKDSDRRDALKNFTDDQYADIRLAIQSMPHLQVECKLEVLDDEEPSVITAGAIVTATVKLERLTMKSFSGDKDVKDTKTEVSDITDADSDDNNNANKENDGTMPAAAESEPILKNVDKSKGSKDVGTASSNNVQKTSRSVDVDDDDEWDRKFQERVIKKQKVFESRPKKSHPVHCPYFPDEKQEFWWVYIVDRKRFSLVTAPLLVTNLVEKEEIELKFTAPNVGVYSYTVVVRSDSYVDSVVQRPIRIEVKPAKEYVEVVYDIPEDETEMDAEDHSAMEDSDLLTDTDDD